MSQSGLPVSLPQHIYIYAVDAVELKTGPRFGVSCVKNWSKASVKNWSMFVVSLFSPISILFWGYF